MNKKPLNEYILQFEELINRLTHSPLKTLNPSQKSFIRLSHEEKEDMKQDIMLEILMMYEEFDESKGVPFDGFVKSALPWRVHNKAVKMIEDRKHLVYGYEEEWSYEEEFFKEEETDEDEETLSLIPLLKSPYQRHVLTAIYIENKTVKQTADELGIRQQEVITHRKQAFKNLKKIIKNDS